jgi:hypothetical protein
LLTSAQHFPTPGHGWKGVVGSDHSRPRALLPARLGRLRHSRPSYPCAHKLPPCAHKLPPRFPEGRDSLQNKRRAWRCREARAARQGGSNHLTNVCFEIGPLPPLHPSTRLLIIRRRIRRQRGSPVERLRRNPNVPDDCCDRGHTGSAKSSAMKLGFDLLRNYP